MDPYLYIEYPKCLYRTDTDTVVVETEEEEVAQAAEGYLTAAQFYNTQTPPTVGKRKK